MQHIRMPDSREPQFQKLVKDFPNSPLGHFSLGKLYLDGGRAAEAVPLLEQATTLDPTYAAALVCLGDAYVATGQVHVARTTFERAKEVALAQKHPGLAEEIDARVQEL